ERTDLVWHCILPEARPGLLYGYRVYGAYAPENGQRFNAHKLLLDPCGQSILGDLKWTNLHLGYRIRRPQGYLALKRRNNAQTMLRCEVVDPAFTWGEDRPPRIPWRDTVIYEMHVKGFTQRHPEITQYRQGTYAGIASQPVIDYLQRLGVTAVELMPVHTFVD